MKNKQVRKLSYRNTINSKKKKKKSDTDYFPF